MEILIKWQTNRLPSNNTSCGYATNTVLMFDVGVPTVTAQNRTLSVVSRTP